MVAAPDPQSGLCSSVSDSWAAPEGRVPELLRAEAEAGRRRASSPVPCTGDTHKAYVMASCPQDCLEGQLGRLLLF